MSFVACVTAMQLVSQDVGGPCWTRPQAVCERSLAALTIENPPTSSTLTFVCGGPLESLRMSSSLSEFEPDDGLARFRDGPLAEGEEEKEVPG